MRICDGRLEGRWLCDRSFRVGGDKVNQIGLFRINGNSGVGRDRDIPVPV